MNLNQIVSKIVAAFKKEVISTAATKGATVQAEAAKAVGAKSASKIVAGLKPFLIVSAADAVISKIPVLNEIVSRVQQVKDLMLDKTIGQIPVVGKVWMQGNRLAMSMLAPEARKYVEKATPETLFNSINDATSQVYNWFKKKEDSGQGQMKINDPKFYTHLGTHIAYSIPLCYPDDGGVPYAGTKDFASLGIVRLGYNPLTSYTRIKNRYTQMLDLLKGVRGLSGELPYDEGDLFFYDWNTKYLVLEYFRLKYALKLTTVYSLLKIAMPKYLIEQALGFDANDFIANKADYIALLVQMHEFIKDTVPNFGVINDRIKDLMYKLIPDSNDPKVALYYCTVLDMTTLIPSDGTNDYIVYNSHFSKSTTNIAAGNVDIPLNFTGTTGVTYANYAAQFDQFQIDFPSAHKRYKALKGDLVGTFGLSVTWEDNAIKEVESTKEADMYHKFDELYLTQLQNGTILDRLGSDIRPSGTVSEATTHLISLSSVTIPTLTNGQLSNLLAPRVATRDYARITVTSSATNPEGSAGTIVMPQSDGCGGSATGGYVTTTETAIIANKMNLNEGESLEISQLVAWFEENGAAYRSTNNTDEIFEAFQTQLFFIMQYKIIYFDNAAGVLSIDRIRPTAYAVSSGAIFNYNFIASFMRQVQFWSQADYGIKIPCLVFYSNLSSEHLLLDFNIMGSISHKAYQTGVKYATYSQYAADLKVTDKTGKRISNIVEAYKLR